MRLEVTKISTYLQLLFVLVSNFRDVLHIVSESQLLQRFGNVLTRNRLFAFLLADLVCFRGDQSYELDATLDEKIPCILAEGKTRRRWQNLSNYLLNSGYSSDGQYKYPCDSENVIVAQKCCSDG